jgi:ribonuclease P protein component|tara:strand:+ start:157 stop:486 length:330 start_codon:yes stop_codon:yes gene_type:complete
MGLRYSIPSKEGFSKIFSTPEKKHSTKNLLVLSKENDIEHSRLGVAIRKKDVRLAVKRNRIKRKIKGSFRAKVLELQKKDYVVLVKGKLSDKEKNLTEELEGLWGQFKK